MAEEPGSIEADTAVCMGAGLCAYIAPAHFDVIEGRVAVLRPEVDGASVESVREAVEACPTRALAISPK